VRRPVPSRLLAAAALGALLVTGAAPSSAVPTTTTDATEPPSSPTLTVAGPLSVLSDPAGSTVVWRPATPPRHGDARLELAVDGVPVRAPFARLGDGTFSVRLAGVAGLEPARVSVVAAGRVLAGAGASHGATRRAPAVVTRPTRLVKADPGVRGSHATRSFTYSASGIKVGGLPVRTEVRARVVLPAATAKGERPLVVFLHGRHGTCYSPDGEETIDWPCAPGHKQTPSYLGYEYVQELLASQGFATVSISANGVNGQDWDAWDGGAAARAELVEHHLALLARWNAKGGKGDLARLRGRLDLGRVVLVGHSRGGEGVNRATIDLSARGTTVVRGQVLIAPTDFGLQVSPGVPTSVILPYCDGDVYDLQGQAYVDQGRYVGTRDKALKSAVMVLGANHNYFNSEWTPGLSKAPSSDDWWDAADATCGTTAKGRLTAKQQRAVGATYIAAAVRSMLTRDAADATRLLDGSPVRARSAGKAVVLSAGYTGTRREVASASSDLRLRAKGGMVAEHCVSGFADVTAACEDLAPRSLSPHWLLYGDNAVTPWAQAVSMTWRTKGARLRLTPGTVKDLRATRLDLRVATAGRAASPGFDVVLRDVRGRTLTLTPERQPQALPAFGGMDQRVWAQTVRVRVPKKAAKIDLAKIRSITIEATSAKGRMFFLDAFTSRTKQPAFRRAHTKVPTFEVASTAVTVGETPSGVQSVDVTITARRNATKASRIAITAMSPLGAVTQRAVTVPAGRSTVTVPVTVPADGVFAPPLEGLVTVTPLRNAVATTYLGTVDVTSSAPVPTVHFPTAHVEVTQGETVEWPYHLSGLVAELVYVTGQFEAPEGGAAELTSAHVPASLYTVVGMLPPPRATPLSESWLGLADVIAPLKSGGTLELPTRATPALAAPAHVRLVVLPDDWHVTEPIILTATINPAS